MEQKTLTEETDIQGIEEQEPLDENSGYYFLNAADIPVNTFQRSGSSSRIVSYFRQIVPLFSYKEIVLSRFFKNKESLFFIEYLNCLAMKAHFGYYIFELRKMRI